MIKLILAVQFSEVTIIDVPEAVEPRADGIYGVHQKIPWDFLRQETEHCSGGTHRHFQVTLEENGLG